MSKSNSESPASSPLASLRRRLSSNRRTAPGAMPGTLHVDPNAHPSRIRVIAYGPENVSDHEDVSADSVSSHLKQKPVTWINVNGLGDKETIAALGKLFDLHRLVLEDIVNVHQRAKVEEFEGHLFIVARMVSLNDHLETEQISLILCDDIVITFQERPGDCLEPVRNRIRSGHGRIRFAGADYLAYALLDAIIDGYFPVLEKLGDQLDALEDELLNRPTPKVIARIHRLRSELFMLRRAIWPHREAVNSLLRESTMHITEDTRPYLRDCYDHAVQIIDVTETSREIASDLRDFHFTQVGMRQNEIMKVLTIVATVFMPLGFVAGLYGMNFDSGASPLNMPELKWYFGYPFALSVMASMAIGMLLYFRYRGWLGGDS